VALSQNAILAGKSALNPNWTTKIVRPQRTNDSLVQRVGWLPFISVGTFWVAAALRSYLSNGDPVDSD
jgi:hypothetical protein